MRTPTVSTAVEPGTGGRFNYVVTTSTGYRAVLERCDRDGCADGSYTECRRMLNERGQHTTGGKNSVDAWLRHIKTRCHGWHDGRVEDFAKAVLNTYGHRNAPSLPTRGRHAPMPVERVADALGLTVEQYQAELAKAAA